MATGFALGLERVDGAGADTAAAGFALLVATGFVLGFAGVEGAGADSAAAGVVDAGVSLNTQSSISSQASNSGVGSEGYAIVFFSGLIE